ncbi:alpha-galactosidase [Nocardioides mesophilus]|uniref:alpha-galactosidase n=1 Tax=Nocardioides mesophilus TaxID=433659 RepID=A0A7G9RDF0_9ACTN|nr:alpha-galactosidase [Nocardioides mesophilus]QNN53625.1 alpha-galactosidase [Nocardioides mesophilus]
MTGASEPVHSDAGTVHLRRAGTSVLLALPAHPDATGAPDGSLPAVVHWGADLGDLTNEAAAAVERATRPVVPHSALDRAFRLPLLPQPARGWTGRRVLEGRVLGGAGLPAVPLLAGAGPAEVEDGDETTAARVTFRSADAELGLEVRTELELTPEGLLRVRHTLRAGTGAGAAAGFEVAHLLSCLPLPAPATELLDLTGRWCRERAPQRQPIHQGAWVRDSWHGRTGHDATLLMVAGTPGFGFGRGEVWGVHTAWSGDHTTWVERLPTGEAVIGGGELLGPGEVRLEAGEGYTTPWVYAGWSDRGLDGLTDRFHRHLRARPQHVERPRPVVLNTWEAVYFDQDLDGLTALADAAAAIGVERFVLDDGWFLGRRDDQRGLGDWTVDPDVWPAGLTPLVEHVVGRGMEFGLWVEPEMVNQDSDLFREHPEWMLRGRETDPPPWRHQQVLDLRVPEAYAHLRDALLGLLDGHAISFLKWDMNRDLVDTGPGVHAQTQAVYRLLDELKSAHPEVEIESCSSGGARVDLAVLERTDRIWASDCIDALERQSIQRWTSLLVPLELMGAHVGGPEAHTTGRRHRLAFRAATALFGHFGIEWDLRGLSEAESTELAGWIGLYREHRSLLHTGRLHRADSPDESLWVHGVVAEDGGRALYAVVRTATSADAVPSPVRLPGLDPGRDYEVRVVGPVPAERAPRLQLSEGWTPGPLLLSGAALGTVGLVPPVLAPEDAVVLEVSAVPR